MKTSGNILESTLREMGVEIPDNLGDLTLEAVGLDSIEIVDLVTAVGRRLGTNLPDVPDADVTVGDLVDHFDLLTTAAGKSKES